MSKKKEQKTFLRFFRFTARVWIISMPAVIILALLLLFQKIGLWTALACLAGALVFTAVLTSSVFKELENFISYLKNLAQGWDIEPPHFNKGVFSSFRLADTFQSVKNKWLSQTLSDAQILDNLSIPLVLTDEKKKIVSANQKAKSVFGENIAGQVMDQVFHGGIFGSAAQKVLAEQAATEWFEWTDAPKGYTFQVRIERLPAPTREGGIVVITLYDVTPFKQFREQQLEFFANANHELKTPLSVISGMIETLQGAAKDDAKAREQFLAMMAEQASQMTTLVQRLLTLARQQMISEKTPDETVAVDHVVAKVVKNLKLKAQRYHKKIVFDTIKSAPKVSGNREDLGHVFQNLIDNAIKYGDNHTQIRVKVAVKKEFPNRKGVSAVVVSVHNKGCPIASRHLDKLFDRFYRVESGQNKHIEGMGLGLKIAHQIVQDHNGMIDVISSAREGTTFAVYLPIKKSEKNLKSA